MLLHICRVTASISPDLRLLLLSLPQRFQRRGLYTSLPIRSAREWKLRSHSQAAFIHRRSTKVKKVPEKEKGTKMEEEGVGMDQLLSMGFPSELASQALVATGGQSVLKATEWILSHRSSDSRDSNPTNTSVQPRLDKFFRTNNRPSENQDDSEKKSQEPIETNKRRRKEPKILSPAPAPAKSRSKTRQEPLSERMRPRTIHEVVGQEHILSPNSLLFAAIERNSLPSIILWGPPGTGKTSIAKSIVNSFKDQSFYRFVSLSAVTSGVKDVRDTVEEAKKLKVYNKRTVLFVDEVHRFNKSQQDSFLPVIEDGSIVFMGATTENPSFHLITPLLSRCRVLTLNPLEPHHVETLLKQAIGDETDRGLAKSVGMSVEANEDVIQFLAANCDGDARVALNALEISTTTAAARVPRSGDANEEGTDRQDGECGSRKVIVTIDDAKEALQCKHLAYDRAGEQHYNLISALHKSMRGGDANAAIYWLARMLQGGEQPLYIARRLIRFASEDVGLADPLALNQAVSCYQACHFLGMPECNVILAQCAAYLALASKSVAVYRAIGAAEKVVRESVGQNEGVPLHLRNAPTKLMKELGYGEGYLYPPDNPDASGQSYLPPSLQGHKFLDWPERNSGDCEES